MKYLLFTFILIIAATCKKTVGSFEPAVSYCSKNADSLYRFPPFGSGTGYSWHDGGQKGDTLWRYPCFNPNNPNEFSVVRDIFYVKRDLFKVNIETGEMTLLREMIYPNNQPIWCKNGWIYYNGHGYKTLRINANDGAIEELTHDNMDYFTTVKIETGEFCTGRMGNQLSAFFIVRYDEIGNIVDTITYDQATHGDWKGDYMAGARSSSNIYLTDLEKNERTFLIKYSPEYIIIKDVKFHPRDPYVFYSIAAKRGLYKINQITSDTTLIKAGSHNTYYGHFSISQDGTKILGEKVYQRIFPAGEIYQDMEIWIMDINGCNERKLNLEY